MKKLRENYVREELFEQLDFESIELLFKVVFNPTVEPRILDLYNKEMPYQDFLHQVKRIIKPHYEFLKSQKSTEHTNEEDHVAQSSTAPVDGEFIAKVFQRRVIYLREILFNQKEAPFRNINDSLEWLNKAQYTEVRAFNKWYNSREAAEYKKNRGKHLTTYFLEKAVKQIISQNMTPLFEVESKPLSSVKILPYKDQKFLVLFEQSKLSILYFQTLQFSKESGVLHESMIHYVLTGDIPDRPKWIIKDKRNERFPIRGAAESYEGENGEQKFRLIKSRWQKVLTLDIYGTLNRSDLDHLNEQVSKEIGDPKIDKYFNIWQAAKEEGWAQNEESWQWGTKNTHREKIAKKLQNRGYDLTGEDVRKYLNERIPPELIDEWENNYNS